jgi:benzoyl-CoA reductase/2-hydroxyglutaryl-CoA dehydratase subunit BcrC/BadD/HgdB
MDDIVHLWRTDNQADGVIDYALQFCGLYTTESHLVAQAMKQAVLPMLQVVTDYSAEDTAQLSTRVQAFSGDALGNSQC